MYKHTCSSSVIFAEKLVLLSLPDVPHRASASGMHSGDWVSGTLLTFFPFACHTSSISYQHFLGSPPKYLHSNICVQQKMNLA